MELQKILQKIRAAGAILVSLSLTGCAAGLGEQFKDTEWILETMNSDELPDKAPTIMLHLRVDSTFTGYSGCNNYLGRYAVTPSEQRIQISAIKRGSRQCKPAERMDLEREYIDALQTAEHYTLKEGTLELQTAAGFPILVFSEDGGSIHAR